MNDPLYPLGILPEDMGWRPPRQYTRSNLPTPTKLEECLLGRLVIDAEILERLAPPRFSHGNKQMLYQLSCSRPTSGSMIITRWKEWQIPEDSRLPRSTKITVLKNAYTYENPQSADCVHWHVNFADPNIFIAYAGPLFAQDEIQVTEHPGLASVREYLIDKQKNHDDGLLPRTRLEGRPTPLLIAGVQRKLSLVLDGIYGNSFSMTSRDQIRRQTTLLDPPTVTNFLCIAAMSRGSGYYLESEILYHFITAFTGFAAAKSRVANSQDPEWNKRVIVHTGNWGCGAFGGNRMLMALIQFMAAQFAGIDELVFHAFDQSGVDICSAALALLESRVYSLSEPLPFSAICSFLHMQNYKWGVSDGN